MFRRLTPVRALLLLALIAAIALTATAAAGTLMPGDRPLATAVQATPGGRFLDPIADFIAPRYFEYPIVAAAAVLALARRDYALALGAIIVLAAAALNPWLKDVIARPRPGPEDVTIRERAPGYGYPSGHVWGAMLLYGYAVVVALRHAPPRVREIAVGAGVMAILLIAWDRVWDGAHWPSDTAGSAAICVLLLAAIVRLSYATTRRDAGDRAASAQPAVPPRRDASR